MGLIYDQAELSIIARREYTVDADAPLTGLSPASRSMTQHTEAVEGLRLYRQLNTSI